MMFED
eukprot:gene19419-25296_t